MDEIPEVRGIGYVASDGERVALLNGYDVAKWLRHPSHNMNTQQWLAIYELAEMIESISDQMLQRDKGL